MDKAELIDRLEALCVKRECCTFDLRRKALEALDRDQAAAEEVVRHLVDGKFADDRRYAEAFAREKSAITGWGPEKIRYTLRMKGISRQDIDAALEQRDPEASARRLEKVCEAKWKTLQGDPYAKFKLIKYALSRGYGYDEVSEIAESLLKK